MQFIKPEVWFRFYQVVAYTGIQSQEQKIINSTPFFISNFNLLPAQKGRHKISFRAEGQFVRSMC